VPFTCEQCGTTFDLPRGVREKYPNWTPRTCNSCRPPRAGSPAAATAAARPSATKELNLPVAEVLARFSAGPADGVFTDGSCSGNPGPGGWGAVKVRGGTVLAEGHGSEPHTTNNRMELTAMIAGLEMLQPDEEADVYSDSQLVVNTLTKWAAGWEKAGWRRREGPVKNLDLVQRAWALARARPGARIHWIRAHDGSRWNESADSLATADLRDEL
jgi:ribonuclease HI